MIEDPVEFKYRWNLFLPGNMGCHDQTLSVEFLTSNSSELSLVMMTVTVMVIMMILTMTVKTMTMFGCFT